MSFKKLIKKGQSGKPARLRRKSVMSHRTLLSRHRQAEGAVRRLRDLNRAILSALTDNIAVINRSGTIVAVNDAWKRFAAENGAPELADRSLGMNYLETCTRAMSTDNTARQVYDGLLGVLSGRLPLFTIEYPCHSPDQRRWFLLHVTPLSEAQGGAVVSHINITERKLMEEQLSERELKIRALLEGLPHGIYVCDADGRVTQTNEAYAKITGYDRDEILRMHVWDFMEPGPEKDSLPAYLKRLVAEQPPPEPFHCRNKNKDGRVIEVQVDWVYRRSADGTVTGFFCLLSDITERKRLEDAIKRQATTDPLTGLPNRTLFMERLRAGLNHARRTGELLAVLFLDLDDLKGINDTLGHLVGDQLLLTVGERLRSCVRITDTVARFGGDEYNLLLAPISRRNDVLAIADKIVSRIRAPIMIGEGSFSVTASLGISLFPDNGEDAETLLHKADNALYHVKRHGKNGYVLYRPSMDSAAPAERTAG